MRPLSLRIEGLRSFREEVAIDFGDRRQIAVVGDTGAGKSSILEAMTYALYGRTSFAHASQDLMNDTSGRLRVVLRFRVSGQEWDVTRTLRRDGKGKVKPSGARLRLPGKDGEPAELVEQVRRVDERIEQLIGLDSDAFLRTVILPQGRFARLLVEDRPAKRGEVLRQLWPTGDLEHVGGLAKEALEDVSRTRAMLDHEATARPEDPEAHLAELNEAAATARRQADAASELADEASRAFRSMKEASEEGKRASKAGAQLAAGLSRIGEAEAQVASVAEVLGEIDKDDEALKRQLADLRDELDRIPTEDGPNIEVVATALTQLNSFDGLAKAAVEAAEEMRDKAARAESRRGDAGRARDAAAKATEAAERHAKQRPPLAEAAETARAHREKARLEHQRCEGLRGPAEEAQRKIAELANQRSELAARAKQAAEKTENDERAVATMEKRLAAARRANFAAAAAHGLHPGDDCPVCMRGLPEDWSPPKDAGHADAESALRQAREAAQESDRRSEGIRAETKAVEQQLSDARDGRQQASEQYRAALTRLVSEFRDASADVLAGSAADMARSGAADDAAKARAADGTPPLPSLDALLRPLEAAHRTASDALERHDEEHKVLNNEQARLATAAAKAEADARNAGERATDARRQAVDALARLARNTEGTPSPYQPQVDLPRDPDKLDKIDPSAAKRRTATALERQRVLKKREQRRNQLETKRDEADKAREALAQRRIAEVEQPLAAVVEPLGRHRDDVLRALHDLGLGDGPGADADLPRRPSALDPATHQVWLRNLHGRTEAVVETARTRANEAATAEKATRDALEELGRRLAAEREADEPSLDAEAGAADTPVAEFPSSPEEVLSDALAARDAAEHDARSAVRDRDAFAAVKDHVLDLRALLGQADRLERALSDLDKALKPGAFLKWLTLRRSRSLLVHASRALGEISGDKYAFAEPEDDDAQWSVLDRHSGQPRAPASLSGGEQFIASLALALGMVEMMAHSGGRLESFFLDEGFGALDRQNLDAAVEALGAVANSGRMVGVISHLRAVAEQIDHVLEVERTAAGSRAKWLSRQERRRWAASDAGREVSAAYGGLVE